MNDTNIAAATTRLAAAAEALEQTIARISASHDALHAKVDRIIAAIDEHALAATEDFESRIAALERENAELKASAESQHSTEVGAPPSSRAHTSDRVGENTGAPPLSAASADRVGSPRKTLAPFVSMLLSKSGADDTSIAADSAILDKALASLSVEQRVAVKAELSRAGLIA